MRRFFNLSALFAFPMILAFSAGVFGQEQPIRAGADAPADINRVIRSFTAKESLFRQALTQYIFKRDAVVQTIGQGGQISGEYHRVSYFTFDDSGARYEKITFFPQPTLTEVAFTDADLEDLGGVQPFALEAEKLDQYNFQYVGKQKIDELDLYVFDVSPKFIPKKITQRFFQGRIWVDDRDLQIVKVKGKGVPQDKENQFPLFETYREQIDGKFWFPTYTYADDELVFGNGQHVHLRMKVTYSDYKRGRADVKITDIDGPGTSDDSTKPAVKPTQPPKRP